MRLSLKRLSLEKAFRILLYGCQEMPASLGAVAVARWRACGRGLNGCLAWSCSASDEKRAPDNDQAETMALSSARCPGASSCGHLARVVALAEA